MFCFERGVPARKNGKEVITKKKRDRIDLMLRDLHCPLICRSVSARKYNNWSGTFLHGKKKKEIVDFIQIVLKSVDTYLVGAD